MREKIDFHAHILPGADHGSDSVSVSLAQLTLMREAGTTAVVATPHFEPQNDTVESFLQRRRSAAAALLPHLDGTMPRVYLGAEVLICAGLDQMPGLEKLCIAGTNVLLLERPFYPLTEDIDRAIYAIAKKGYTAILAHIDRYPVKETDAVMYHGVYGQLNSKNLTSPLRRLAYRHFFRDGRIVALGSDIHKVPPQYNQFPKMPSVLKSTFDSVMEKSRALLTDAFPLTAENLAAERF